MLRKMSETLGFFSLIILTSRFLHLSFSDGTAFTPQPPNDSRDQSVSISNVIRDQAQE